MTSSAFRRAPFALVMLAAALSLTACVAPAAPRPTASAGASSSEHGIDGGGGVEVAAPALALMVADESGALTLLDLETDQRTALGDRREGLQSMVTDGRRVYLAHGVDSEMTVDIVDSGRWTVPHGDHSHSFLAEPRTVGAVEGEGVATVRVGDLGTAVRFAGGDTVVLDHETLGEKSFEAPEPLEASEPVALGGVALPFAGHLIAATETSVEIRDVDGAITSAEGAACAHATDADISRVGAVFTCAHGAVLLTREVGGAVSVETIPYPAEATPTTALSGRPDRPDLAGTAGDQGAWLLDVRQRQWTLLPSDVPLLRASALGDDDSRTVAIDADGRVRVLAADGAVLVRTEPLLAASVADPVLRDRVQLLVDAHHAYVTDPATGAVHEIHHRDGRVTRTFTDLDPWFVQQVG